MNSIISKTMGVAFLGGALGALCLLAAYVSVYGLPVTPRIGVVNIQDILERHVTDSAARNLTKNEQRDAASQFSRALESEIAKLANDEQVRLFVAPAVLSRVPDYTGYIEQRLKVDYAR